MAWEYIDWSCGHEDRKQLYGPNKERERYVAWAEESGICPDCYREQKRAESAEAGPQFYARKTSQGVEIVCWSESFGIKDDLKARGWRFGHVYPPVGGRDILEMESLKGWTLVAEKQEDAEKEVAWIAEQGWSFRVQGVGEGMFAALAEGRPDLVPGWKG
jgi:hypothetical protein